MWIYLTTCIKAALYDKDDDKEWEKIFATNVKTKYFWLGYISSNKSKQKDKTVPQTYGQRI